MTARAVLLLGRAPSAASVLDEVVARLRAQGVEVRLEVVARGDELPPVDADLLVLRDLTAAQLQAVERTGLPSCNPAAAHRDTLDKLHVVQVLGDAGVAVPATASADRWQDVRAAAEAGPVVVKPREGTQGAGVLVLDGAAPTAPAGPGPWLVQERVPALGPDRKLYVVGDAVDGVLRVWPAPPDRAGEPFVPEPALAGPARAAAAALGLDVCGVDVVAGPDGPVVVDVNAFPGFKGVPGAPARLAAHLAARLAAAPAPRPALSPRTSEALPCRS